VKRIESNKREGLTPSQFKSGAAWIRFPLIFLLFFSGSHALWLRSSVEAFQVASGDIKVDGKPEAVWKAIAAANYDSQTVNFFDYGKTVILGSDAVRNDPDPSKYYKPKAPGSATLLAAYDNTALYFFFLIKEQDLFDGRTACKDTVNWWKAHAAEVYVDYTAWSETAYQSYFTADAGGVTFGTSKKSLQLDKAALPADTRKYYRDRSKNDRFQTRTPLPTGLEAVSAAHSASDPHTLGVEMKIPFPSGTASSFAVGNSIFISWGYNHYPDTAKADCSGNPIAYRWAKHYKTYSSTGIKPPGWRDKDSTHYDPARSWDGWGQLHLNPRAVNSSSCLGVDDSQWDVGYWKYKCGGATSISPSLMKAPPAPFTAGGKARDARGREVKDRPASILFRDFPARP
jgi:hypothetical protein